MQEALSSAGVLGPEPLSLMPQHVPSEPVKRCFRAMAANPFFFDNLEHAAAFKTGKEGTRLSNMPQAFALS